MGDGCLVRDLSEQSGLSEQSRIDEFFHPVRCCDPTLVWSDQLDRDINGDRGRYPADPEWPFPPASSADSENDELEFLRAASFEQHLQEQFETAKQNGSYVDLDCTTTGTSSLT